MEKVFLSVGANLGNREKTLVVAVGLLKLQNKKTSSIYETEPWGNKNQPWFLNLVVEGETEMTPQDLLTHIQSVEQQLGRDRQSENLSDQTQKYSPRLIDIDILYYDDLVLKIPNLIIPHPLLEKRRFILEPLNEIASSFLHPLLKKTTKELLNGCADTSIVRKLKTL